MKLVLVLDCADPPRLASFWAQALDYVDAGLAEPYSVLLPADGHGPELLLQRVSEAKTGKNRMHVDLRTHDLDGEVSRLEALGARRLTPPADVVEEHGFRWVVMADPEGNEFCICREPG